jgi:hypothetical protein
VASDEAFFICRGFSHLRSRLLLLKQDRLVVLEKRLREIDYAETAPLFLGASREDTNTQRRQVLEEIDVALSDYGCLLPSRLFPLPNSRNRWVDGKDVPRPRLETTSST